MRSSAHNASFDAAGTVCVTERAERYRRNFNDLGAKRALLVMANAWLMLAARVEKNVETASPNKPPSSAPPFEEPPKLPPANEPLPLR